MLTRPLSNILWTYMLTCVKMLLKACCVLYENMNMRSSHCNCFQGLEVHFWSAWVNTKTSQSFLRYLYIGMLQAWNWKFIPNLYWIRWVWDHCRRGSQSEVTEIQFSFCSACFEQDFCEATDQFRAEQIQLRAGSWTASPNSNTAQQAPHFPGKPKTVVVPLPFILT